MAFANLWLGADRQELSVDLMRYTSDAPESVMEYLFVQLMLWGKAQGYAEFNLGMAPLSGLSSSEAAPNWQRMGAALFEHGVPSYNFKGLRSFKDKLKPVWRPRYLAIAGGAAPAMVLIDATRLIGRGARENR